MDGSVTRLLTAWRGGDDSALGRLMPLIYAELHEIAGRAMRPESSGHTLTPTALVHEWFLGIEHLHQVPWTDRAHFLALAARSMRRLLVDHARARLADKRDGGERVTLNGLDLPQPDRQFDVLMVDQALARLQRIDARKAEIVELRLFAGLDFAELGAVTGLSRATLDREFRAARAWLFRELQ